MAEHAQEELENLFKSLRKLGAGELFEDIQLVIARGATKEVESKGRVKELTQTPLEPEEAYIVAVEMVVASMEPLLMPKSIKEELSISDAQNIDIDWQKDFIEKSPIEPLEFKEIRLPVIEPSELAEFRQDLKDLLTLLQGDGSGQH